LEQLRNPVASEMFRSGGPDLAAQLLRADKIDYAQIDLRDGRSWLASRLYIFADLLRRQRGLRCIVFVERGGTPGGRFIGLADPADVILAMNSRFGWFKEALGGAYGFATPVSQILTSEGLNPTLAQQVATNFLSHPDIQWTSGERILGPW
jgi:hypothetical protein